MSTKQKAKSMVGVIIALVIAGVLIGYVLPIGVGSVSTTENTTINQDVGTEYSVETQLNSTVTAVTDATDATVELTDLSAGGATTSNTVSVGSTTTYSLSGGDVNVTVNSATSGTPGNASVTYEHPNDFGWSDGSQQLFGLVPLFLVLTPFVVVIGWAMKSM